MKTEFLVSQREGGILKSVTVPTRKTNTTSVNKYFLSFASTKCSTVLEKFSKSSLSFKSKLSGINSFFNLTRDSDEYGNYVYMHSNIKKNDVKIETILTKVWVSIINNHLMYTKTIYLKIYHLAFCKVISDSPKEERLADGTVRYSFIVEIDKRSKVFYCKKETDCKQWIENLKNLTGYKDFSANYKLGEMISLDLNGIYHKATSLKNRQTHMVKVVKKDQLSEKDYWQLKESLDILERLSHPNIVKLFASYEDKENIYIVTEYLAGCDLAGRLTDKGISISVETKNMLACDLAKGLNYLHNMGVMLRNLCPENIWLTSKTVLYSIPKIVDLSTCTILGFNEMTEGRFGNSNFMAPEVHVNNKYNHSSDVFSYGALVNYLFSGFYLFHEIRDKVKRIEAVLYKEIQFKHWEGNEEILLLVKMCLAKEQAMRIKTAEIAELGIFKKYRK
jgi:hypothetical protein